MRLILYRALAAVTIAIVLALWVYPASTQAQQQLMLLTGMAFVLLFLVQLGLSFSTLPEPGQWLFQYASDVILASVLIFASGGIGSPFSLLLGLIIIASGTHALRVMPLTISMLACSGYLAAVYGEVWLVRFADLNTQQALQLLLQVSALMLVGGVMAYIARRHATLRASSVQAVTRHRKLKDMHDKIMAEMREGVIVLDRRLQVSDMNDAARELLGLQPVASLLAIPALENFFRQSAVASCQCEYVRGEQVLLLAVRRLSEDEDACWLLTIVDISDVRRLEQQLVQQEKMAALGNMAAQLAHEIRNPLQTMSHGLEIVGKSPERGEKVSEIMHDEMLRLNRMVSAMLEYSRPLQPEPEPTYMPELIQSSLAQVDAARRDEVRCRCGVDEMVVDGDHFRLVADNLLTNALANSAGDDGVELRLDSMGESWELCVCNRGEINDEIREKLFEPFVSGRSTGTGLGLATVKQVCAINGWQVDVESRDGRTCFRVNGPLRPEIMRHVEAGVEEKHG